MNGNQNYIKNFKKGDKVTTNDSWFLTKGFNNVTGVIVGFEKDEVGSWQYLIDLDDGRTLKCDDIHLINIKRSNQMDKLIEQVENWSKDKGLDKAESSKQFLKVTEEVGEVAAALARSNKDELKDGIGDVIVTLIILGQQNELTLQECLEQAYGEISGRTGKMVDGVFIKSEDLEG